MQTQTHIAHGAADRTRLQMLFSSAFFLGLVFAALDIVLPLWITGALGFSAADWANIRALRMAGILVSVVLLGALSDRFGQRRLGWLSLLGCGAALAALSVGGAASVWILVPIIGGCMSTAFVNMNTLTQGLSARRQGALNSAYRSIHGATGIIAPVAVTGLAFLFGGYPRVLGLCAASLWIAALLLRRFPREQTAPFGTLAAEFRNLLGGYTVALRQRPLMRFIVLSLLWGSAMSAVTAFAAIRLVRELGIDDRTFGLISAIGGGLALGNILLSGLLLDRVRLRTFCLWVSTAASVFALTMGLSNNPTISAIAYALHLAFSSALNAPVSMWLSRASGAASQTSAFAVHKVMAGGMFAAAMLAMGWLEPRIGIRALLGWSGLVGFLLSLGYIFLAEPKQRRGQEPGAATNDT